jgi:hypothetical protein
MCKTIFIRAKNIIKINQGQNLKNTHFIGPKIYLILCYISILPIIYQESMKSL